MFKNQFKPRPSKRLTWKVECRFAWEKDASKEGAIPMRKLSAAKSTLESWEDKGQRCRWRRWGI